MKVSEQRAKRVLQALEQSWTTKEIAITLGFSRRQVYALQRQWKKLQARQGK